LANAARLSNLPSIKTICASELKRGSFRSAVRFFGASGNNSRVNQRTDSELLHDYFERRSESAFAEIVDRYVALVYSVARRAVVDEHLAEDVTQTTFTILAREARHLSGRTVLSTWLHRTAFNQAAKLVRDEMRRRTREQEAYAMQMLPTDSDHDWKRIAPMLDAALDKLAEADRAAILLRYFENKSAKEIGNALQLSEEAAQKRVTRALERLRGLLVNKTARLSASSLAALVASHAVDAAPLGLSTSVSAAAVAAGVIQGGTTISTLKFIVMSKLKTTVVSALVAAAIVTPIVLQHQAAARLTAENAALQEQAQQADELRDENAKLTAQLSDARRPPPISTDQSELLRLRKEVGRLRGLESEVAKLREDESQKFQTWAREAQQFAENERDFTVDRLSRVDVLKRVGQQLRALAVANNLGAAFTPDGKLTPDLSFLLDKGNVEFAESDPTQLQQLLQDGGSDTIVARTVEPMHTPDDQWMRFYVMADGSIQSYSTPFSNQVFSANWQLQQLNP
jgi:RNA polymerase sigma factor (sigma-70 family)